MMAFSDFRRLVHSYGRVKATVVTTGPKGRTVDALLTEADIHHAIRRNLIATEMGLINARVDRQRLVLNTPIHVPAAA